jgi:hypothetical protein
MRLLNLFLLVAPTLANILVPEVAVAVSTPTKALEARDVDRVCLTSVWDQLSPPTPTERRLSTLITGSKCTITAAASLSWPLESYVSALSTYLITIESKAKEVHTKCGVDKLSFTISLACTKSIDVLFTANSTTKTTSFALPDRIATSIPLGGASGRSLPCLSLVLGVAVLASWLFC